MQTHLNANPFQCSHLEVSRVHPGFNCAKKGCSTVSLRARMRSSSRSNLA